jgi:hypothetical protein
MYALIVGGICADFTSVLGWQAGLTIVGLRLSALTGTQVQSLIHADPSEWIGSADEHIQHIGGKPVLVVALSGENSVATALELAGTKTMLFDMYLLRIMQTYTQVLWTPVLQHCHIHPHCAGRLALDPLCATASLVCSNCSSSLCYY